MHLQLMLTDPLQEFAAGVPLGGSILALNPHYVSRLDAITPEVCGASSRMPNPFFH
jgi:hypothetical protein